MPSRPAIGRNTNGGREITSNPLSETPAAGLGVGPRLTTGSGEGEGDSDGEGVGVAGGLIVKNAHGLGCTLAHSLCGPGASPGKGLTRVLKLPLPSERAAPATCAAWSQ